MPARFFLGIPCAQCRLYVFGRAVDQNQLALGRVVAVLHAGRARNLPLGQRLECRRVNVNAA